MNAPTSVRKLGLLYALFLVLCFFALKPGLLILDGLAYYSYLPSLFLDGDLNFWNEFRFGGVLNESGSRTRGITEAGYVSNHWSIGPASLWWPFWAAGHLLTRTTQEFHEPWPMNGFSVYYNIGVRFATAILGLSALIFCFFALRRSIASRHTLAALVLVAFGTPFFWYTFVNADTSHVPAAFAIALFLVTYETRMRCGYTRSLAIALGFAAGLATLIRIQDAVIFLFLAVPWAQEIKSGGKSIRNLLREMFWVGLTASAVIALQLFVWDIVFGSPLGPIVQSPPFEDGSNFYYIFSGHFHAYEVLFSSYHGIFFFSPLLLFSFLGLFLSLRLAKTRAMGAVSLTILFIQLFLMANERWFWEGTSFGMRRLVDWTPLFIFGLAALFDEVPRMWIRAVSVLAACWGLLLHWTYAIRPLHLLFEYQTPDVIFKWVFQTVVVDLLKNVKHIFVPTAPASILVISLIWFGSLGFIALLAIIRFVEAIQDGKKKTMQAGFCALLILLGTMYALTARAARNGERSKSQYASQLKWLKDESRNGYAQGIAEHIFSEAKFLALSKGWEPAKKSFQEALQISPTPDSMRLRIATFIRMHLSEEEAKQYLSTL